MQDILIAGPEVFLLCMLCLIMVVDLYIAKGNRTITYVLTLVTFVTAAILCSSQPDTRILAFNEHYVVDPISQFLKCVMLSLMAVIMLYARPYLNRRNIQKGEYYLLSLFATLGMMLLVSANTLLMVYLGLEALSLPLYALVALNRDDPQAIEAGMKYFIMGALASGLLLYGISIIYGVTGSIGLTEIATQISGLADLHQESQLLSFGLIFILVGVAFKLGAVPFHMWMPDVYQGSSSPVTLILATASKVAAFGMLYRLFGQALVGLNVEWTQLLTVMAVLSLAIGNIVAIAQTNLKRLLAYSTIAHVGFIFLGFLSGPELGFSAALFYVVSYAIVTCCAFGIIVYLSQKGNDVQNIQDLKGLAKRSPWLAFLMLLVMFSLAGVPPTVGFYAKFVVLNALVSQGSFMLAIIAVVFSIVGAFYYLRVVKVMYFDEPEILALEHGAFDFRVVVSLNGLAVLLLGILPAPLFQLCQISNYSTYIW